LKRWAFSLLAYRHRQSGNVVTQCSHMSCAMLEAASEDEARGKAARIGKKLYPPQEGFTGHEVSVSSADNVVDYDGVGFVPQ